MDTDRARKAVDVGADGPDAPGSGAGAQVGESCTVRGFGGGSTEITVGERRRGVFWSRSVDIGSLRLTAAKLDGDPATRAQLAEAEAYVSQLFADVRPPSTGSALAVGGSARALAKLVGGRLDEAALDRALQITASQSAEQLACSGAIDATRAATLTG